MATERDNIIEIGGEECDDSIEFLNDQKMATVTFSRRKFINKVLKMQRKFPDKVQIIRYPEENGGYLLAKIPVKSIRIYWLNPTRTSGFGFKKGAKSEILEPDKQ